jgi:hypothetical protein
MARRWRSRVRELCTFVKFKVKRLKNIWLSLDLEKFMSNKLLFSGHNTFTCKQYWLHKGYEFVKERKIFNEENAVVDLGVGKNMVNAIRYWLRSFGLVDEYDELTLLAKKIFDRNGWDPFLEDIGSLWILHYLLIKSDRASIYNLVFNDFRKERIEFTKGQLLNFLKKTCDETDNANFTESTLASDTNVFLRTYLPPKKDRETKIEIEEDFSSLLIDLELLDSYKQVVDREGKPEIINWYKIENNFRDTLPYQIVLFVIVENIGGNLTVSFNELLRGINSPGAIFALHDDGLFDKIEEICKANPRKIIFSETAGNRILQFKEKPNAIEILKAYYTK